MTLFNSRGHIEKAIQECSKALEKSPGDSRVRLKLGDLHLKNGDDQRAIKEYLQTAELYAKEDFNTQAIAIYKRIVSIDPKHIEAIHRLAKLYLKESFLGDARRRYEDILKIKPDDQEAIMALSAIENSRQPRRIHAGLQMEGTPPAEPVGAPPPGSSDGAPAYSRGEDLELHYHLGVGYKEMGLFEYAITEFELASEDPSIRVDCYHLLGKCLEEKGDFEQ